MRLLPGFPGFPMSTGNLGYRICSVIRKFVQAPNEQKNFKGPQSFSHR